MTVALVIIIVLLAIGVYGHKLSIERLAERVDELEEKIEELSEPIKGVSDDGYPFTIERA